jgi:hypothetical protein
MDNASSGGDWDPSSKAPFTLNLEIPDRPDHGGQTAVKPSLPHEMEPQ